MRLQCQAGFTRAWPPSEIEHGYSLEASRHTVAWPNKDVSPAKSREQHFAPLGSHPLGGSIPVTKILNSVDSRTPHQSNYGRRNQPALWGK